MSDNKINVGKPDSGDQRNILQKVKDHFDLNKIARENAKKEEEERKQYLKDLVTLSTKVDSPEPKKKWSVLFYVDGNNNLAPMGQHQFTSLTGVGSDKNTNLVGLLSDETGAERGLIKKAGKKSSRLFPGAEQVGKLDMGDPKTLQNFIKWGMKKYPAEHYALVLWDHGAGFMGSMTDDKTKHLIDNKELAGVLNNVKDDTGKKMDVVDFNACLMGQAEVAYELKDGAKYLVASEETEAGLLLPIPGVYGTTPQHKVMTDLKKGVKEKGDVTPEELAKLYVYDSEKQFGSSVFSPTQSAIDLSKMDVVKESADKLAGLLLDEIKKDPKMLDLVRGDVQKTMHYLDMNMYVEPYKNIRDLGHFSQVIAKDERLSKEIRDAASGMGKSIKDAVIAEEHAAENSSGNILAHSTGMSAYMPPNYGHGEPRHNPIDNIPSGGTYGYENTSFAEKTKWDELLQAISKDDDWIAKHHTVRAFVEKTLPIAKYEGYNQAWNVLGGATKPQWFGIGFAPGSAVPIPAPTVVGAVGGVIRGVGGAKKIAAGVDKDLSRTDRRKLTLSGVLDTAIGAGAVGTSVALLAGATAVAFPAAAVVMGLGVGRLVYSLASGWYKAHKADQMTVQQKIDAMDKEMQEKKV